MKVIATIPELIETLGGYAHVARWAGYEDARGVYNWVARGIPPSYHLRVVAEAKRRGVLLDPEALLGVPVDEAVVVRRMLEQDHHAA